MRWDRELCSSEALCDYGAAVDPAGTGRVPEGAGVGEDVLLRGRALLVLA